MSLADQKRTRHFYGRRKGRPLNPARQKALDALLPQLQIPGNDIDETGAFDPCTLFCFSPNRVFFEIGFGNGAHLLSLVQNYPNDAFLGAEPFINGMSAFLKDLEHEKTHNICVLMDDAFMLVNSLCDSSLDGIYILNPDPWPKPKHHKRRIINSDTLTRFARILKPGGRLYITTDSDSMAGWVVRHGIQHDDFIWTARRCADWRTPPHDWQPTRYEQKGQQAGHQQYYLAFVRRNDHNA